MDNFIAIDIQRAAIQTMETSYIIGTSKNIDTIKSRNPTAKYIRFIKA